jgi:HEPN domain-containing protein
MSDEIERDALTWLAFALGDLGAARSRPGRHVQPRIVAFHAQQAAEKALKGALVLAGIDPPRTHDLEEVRRNLPADWTAKRAPADLSTLSRHAVDIRYPDDVGPVSAIQSATAVRQAIAVVRRIREDFQRRGVSTDRLEPR